MALLAARHEGNTMEENNGYVVFKIKYTESIATNDFYANTGASIKVLSSY